MENNLSFCQGWTKFYEFSFADLRAGAETIDRLCVRAGEYYFMFSMLYCYEYYIAKTFPLSYKRENSVYLFILLCT